MNSRPITGGFTALVAMLMVLAVGAALSLAGPSTAQEEGGTPTSMGLKCEACKLLGCPDNSTTPCITTTLKLSAEVAADLKALGVSVGAEGTMEVHCFQGATPCVSDMDESGAS